MSPETLTVKVKMALILIEEKNYLDAIDRLEKILSMAPSSDKIRYYLAAVHEELGDNKQAVYNYKKIGSLKQLLSGRLCPCCQLNEEDR